MNHKDGLTYVWIPPGSFTMGCSPGDSECFPDENPAHLVRISKGFWLGQTDVTNAAYGRVKGSDPIFQEDGNRPVVFVAWDDASQYCGAVGGRLPTEAEWEYAARAGTTGSRYDSLDNIAWYAANSRNETHDVGQKQANPWGLYDMLGDVYQWVSDWHGSYNGAEQGDPQGPSNGQYKVQRGGSGIASSMEVRVSAREKDAPAQSASGIGFRCVGE